MLIPNSNKQKTSQNSSLNKSRVFEDSKDSVTTKFESLMDKIDLLINSINESTLAQNNAIKIMSESVEATKSSIKMQELQTQNLMDLIKTIKEKEEKKKGEK